MKTAAERQRKYREKNPEKCREACRKWRKENPEIFSQSKRRWHGENKQWRKEWLSRRRKQMKDAAFNAYGGYQCVHCKESDPVVLTLDHVNNDGAQHRKNLGNKGGTEFFEVLRRENYPSGFQVLCRNCNWRKHIETLKVQRLER